MDDDQLYPTPTEVHALEQGEADRGETAAVGKARLIHSDEASNRKASPQSLRQQRQRPAPMPVDPRTCTHDVTRRR